MKLRVVEDEPRIAAFLANGLRARGYDVGWASAGREGRGLHRLSGMRPGDRPAA